MPSGLLINIDVPDIDEGVAFYKDGLGFCFQRFLFERDVAELHLNDIRICLLQVSPELEAIPGTGIKRTYEDHWTPVHMDIAVSDIGAAVAKAEAAGARKMGKLDNCDYGKLMRMRDPFGHGFCFIEFAPGGYDRVVFQSEGETNATHHG